MSFVVLFNASHDKQFQLVVLLNIRLVVPYISASVGHVQGPTYRVKGIMHCELKTLTPLSS